MKTKLLLMLFVALLSASAGAAEVAIVNPGFEDPVLTDGGYTYSPTGWVEGWYELGAADPNDWWGYSWGAGAINPDAGYGYDGIAPEGENIAFVTPYPGYDQGLSQILSDTLQAGWIYELSALVGNPYGYNGGETISDYRIELVAGGVRVATDTGPAPAADTWTTASLIFSPGVGHPQIGGALEIRLIMVDFSADYELNFDDIRLNAISDPMEPSPYNGEYVYVGDVDLSWTNMDPNEGVTDVYVDVWFGLDPTKPSKWDKVVDAGENITTVTVSAPDDQTTYYWQVNSYIGGSATGDPIEGRIYKFHTTTDIPPSVEIVSGDMITWSGEPVQLDATVEDDGVSDLTLVWSAASAHSVSFYPNEFVEDPIVTLTNDFTDFPIVEPGFEDPVLSDGEFTYHPTGWKEGYYTIGWPDWTVEVWGCGATNPSPSYGYGGIAPEGENVAEILVDEGYDDGLQKILEYNLQAGWTYELSALVGNPSPYNLAAMGSPTTADHRIELLAGGVVIASTNDKGLGEGDPSPVDDSYWTTASLTFTPDPDHPQLGEPLGIRLLAVDYTYGYKLNFDDVKLSADSFYFTDGDPDPVRLTLAVNDELNPPLVDTMTIDVYDNPCFAAIGAGKDYPGDLDENCITGLEDLAEMLLTWTDDNALTEPKVKETGGPGVADPGLIVGYGFYGDLNDGSGNGFDGIPIGTVAFSSDVPPGRDGQSLLLDGTNHVEVPISEVNPFDGTGEFTIVAWFKSASPGLILSSARDATEDNHSMAFFIYEGDYEGELTYDNFYVSACYDSGPWNDDVWHHGAVTYTPDEIVTMYIDGEFAAENSFNPAIPDIVQDTVLIGSTLNTTFPSCGNWVGNLKDVGVFNIALTEEEIKTVMDEGFGSGDTLDPSPEDGGYVHPASDLELSWENMDPNNPGDSVWVDVWFGTEPNELNPSYEMTKVVDATTPEGEDANSVTVNASTLGETYYWQVNSYLYGDPATTSYDTNPGDPNMVEGRLWKFDTVTDVPVSVKAGYDVVAWSGQEVQLDGTVEDYGEDDVEDIAWSANPDDGVVFSDPGVEDPTVTITKATDNPSIVTLTLSGQDGAGSDKDAMRIEVYDTACMAAIGEGEEFDAGDFDANCITNLEDFAVMAEEWLDDYTLTEPTPKP